MENPLLTEINFFALANYRNQQRRFGIKRDDRRRHMYLIGKTGMGKSSTLENMIVNDIRAGHGIAVIDPHGDLVEKVLGFIPSHRVNDVVFFNPTDIDFPVAFNILESVNPQYKNLIASGLVGVFKKIWADSWGPRLEYILTNTILGLLEYPGSTLLGLTRMLVDKKYRKKVVDQITDPVVKAFWVNEYANYNERFRSEAISPIQNKVGQFLSSSVIRNIVGQSKSTLDIREIMDDQKILLMNLSKGRIGEENSALLGAMMITRLQIAAMSRVDIPETDRKDFYLYVDEFQNFSTDSFADILSEARKYRLNLIIAHQYIEQLSEKVQASVFGNVGTMACFRVGAGDAEFLEKEFAPQFTETDLVNLPKFEVYLKLMIDGVASQPFSATTLPPISGEETTRESVIKASRERYANKREVVEEKILRWSGVDEMYREMAEEENIANSDSSRVRVRPNNFRPQRNYNQEESRGGEKPRYNNRPEYTQQPREQGDRYRDEERERYQEQTPRPKTYTPPMPDRERQEMPPAHITPKRTNRLVSRGGTLPRNTPTRKEEKEEPQQEEKFLSLAEAFGNRNKPASAKPATPPQQSFQKDKGENEDRPPSSKGMSINLLQGLDDDNQ